MKPLNKKQQEMLEKLSRRPLDSYGNKATLKALAVRGLAGKSPTDDFGWMWVITKAGMELVGVSRVQVDYNYAVWALKEVEHEVRHNVQEVYEGFGGWKIKSAWKQDLWRQEVGIERYQKAAARLCLAEMKSGLI